MARGKHILRRWVLKSGQEIDLKKKNAAEIPNDLWPQILLNLPLVCLFRCRSLSKFHQELIDDPYFRRRYSIKSKNQCYLILNNYESGSSVDDLVSFDSTNPSAGAIVHRLIKPSWKDFDTINIIGCCMGIVCLLYKSQRSMEQGIMFWNPVTGTCQKTDVGKAYKLFRYYFGHDSVTDDLKVLRVGTTKNICQIYSLKTKCWENIRDNWFQVTSLEDEYCSDKVDGSNGLHFFRFLNYFVAFDLSTMKFSLVPPPFITRRGCLSSLNGCLCFHDREVNTVWMMKTYGDGRSWTKIYSIDDKAMVSRALRFMDDGRKVLVCETPNWRGIQAFYSYDLEGKKLSKVFSVSRPSLQKNRPYFYTPTTFSDAFSLVDM